MPGWYAVDTGTNLLWICEVLSLRYVRFAIISSDNPHTARPRGKSDWTAVIPYHGTDGCFCEIHLVHGYRLAGCLKTFSGSFCELFTCKDTCQMGKSHPAFSSFCNKCRQRRALWPISSCHLQGGCSHTGSGVSGPGVIVNGPHRIQKIPHSTTTTVRVNRFAFCTSQPSRAKIPSTVSVPGFMARKRHR